MDYILLIYWLDHRSVSAGMVNTYNFSKKHFPIPDANTLSVGVINGVD